MKSRLEEVYNTQIKPALQKELHLKNVMMVPKVSKIVLNIGVKEAVAGMVLLICTQRGQEIAEQYKEAEKEKKCRYDRQDNGDGIG